MDTTTPTPKVKPIDEIVNFFTGNPFSTPVGQKIEEATAPSLPTTNWSLNLEICDLINSDPNQSQTPTQALRAIRKRLTSSQKSPNSLLLTLTVLETCVKNCGPTFHKVAMGKEFINEMVKIIGPKMDPPVEVQEKVLGLIQVWAEAFENEGVREVYEELKSKGVQFPGVDLGEAVPILLPPLKNKPMTTTADIPSTENILTSSSPILHQVDLGEERQIKPTADQLVKLRRDLDLAQGNMTVFAELLNELKPGEEERGDLELVQELYTTSKEIQRRIGDLLCTISNDELTAEMLHVNDELNHLFLRYGRYRKNVEKTGVANAAKSPEEAKTQADAEPSLIDWGNESGEQKMSSAPDVLTGKLSEMSVSSGRKIANAGGESEFDNFAKSRGTAMKTAAYEPESSGSKNLMKAVSKGGGPEDEIMKSHRASDFAEMEAWLEANPQPPSTSSVPSEKLTSSEFDRFLQERAKKDNTKDDEKEKIGDKMWGL